MERITYIRFNNSEIVYTEMLLKLEIFSMFLIQTRKPYKPSSIRIIVFANSHLGPANLTQQCRARANASRSHSAANLSRANGTLSTPRAVCCDDAQRTHGKESNFLITPRNVNF